MCGCQKLIVFTTETKVKVANSIYVYVTILLNLFKLIINIRKYNLFNLLDIISIVHIRWLSKTKNAQTSYIWLSN
jgi:hypothetical protein